MYQMSHIFDADWNSHRSQGIHLAIWVSHAPGFLRKFALQPLCNLHEEESCKKCLDKLFKIYININDSYSKDCHVFKSNALGCFPSAISHEKKNFLRVSPTPSFCTWLFAATVKLHCPVWIVTHLCVCTAHGGCTHTYTHTGTHTRGKWALSTHIKPALDHSVSANRSLSLGLLSGNDKEPWGSGGIRDRMGGEEFDGSTLCVHIVHPPWWWGVWRQGVCEFVI